MTDLPDLLNFRDRQGQPLTVLEWGTKFEDFGYRLVAEDTVQIPGESHVYVRTVWSGALDAFLDHRLFSTAYKINEGTWSTVEQYDTEEEAIAGHLAVVKRIAEPISGRHSRQDVTTGP